MSEYHKMDTYEYSNIFKCIIMYRTNIRIYSGAPYLPNEYLICTPELARIGIKIIFEGNFIRIFEYSYSSPIEDIFGKGSLMLPLNKMLYWIFFMHKLNIDLLFSLKKDRQILKYNVLSKYSDIFKFYRIYEWIFEYILLSKNLQMNIRIYSYWRSGTNMNTNNIWGPFYSNILIFKYSNIHAHHCIITLYVQEN